MKINAVLLSMAMLATGCASQRLNTASGRPEVTVHNQSLARVRTVAINYFVNGGRAPVNTEGSQLTFAKEGSATESVLMGLMTNEPNSRNQITLTLVENGQDVRVIGGGAAIGANTFGRQTVVELQGKGYQQLQQALETIKAEAETGG
jgi:hypothetical protein